MNTQNGHHLAPTANTLLFSIVGLIRIGYLYLLFLLLSFDRLLICRASRKVCWVEQKLVITKTKREGTVITFKIFQKHFFTMCALNCCYSIPALSLNPFNCSQRQLPNFLQVVTWSWQIYLYLIICGDRMIFEQFDLFKMFEESEKDRKSNYLQLE